MDLTFDDEVVQVVADAVRQVLDEHPRMKGSYSRAAARLLREGLAGWGVPVRQVGRDREWRADCRRELRGYLVVR